MADESVKQRWQPNESELEYLTRRLKEGYDMQPASCAAVARLVRDTNAIQDAREVRTAAHEKSEAARRELVKARDRLRALPDSERVEIVETPEFKAYEAAGAAWAAADSAFWEAVESLGRLMR
jgi:hypothetical protein